MLRKKISVSKIIISILIALGLSIVSFIIYTLPWPHPPLWQIEKLSSVQLPDSSIVKNSFGRFFLEIQIMAKIEIDKDDIEPFIKSIRLPKTVYETDPKKEHFKYREHRYRKDQFKWWNPDKARKFKLVVIPMPSDTPRYKCCRILIDLDNPSKAVMYFYYISHYSPRPSH